MDRKMKMEADQPPISSMSETASTIPPANQKPCVPVVVPVTGTTICRAPPPPQQFQMRPTMSPHPLHPPKPSIYRPAANCPPVTGVHQHHTLMSKHFPPVEDPPVNPSLKYRYFQQNLSMNQLTNETKSVLLKISPSMRTNSYPPPPPLAANMNRPLSSEHNQTNSSKSHINSTTLKQEDCKFMSDHIYNHGYKITNSVKPPISIIPKDHLILNDSSSCLNGGNFPQNSPLAADHGDKSWLQNVLSSVDPILESCNYPTSASGPTHLSPSEQQDLPPGQVKELLSAHSKVKSAGKVLQKRKRAELDEIARYSDDLQPISMKEAIIYSDPSSDPIPSMMPTVQNQIRPSDDLRNHHKFSAQSTPIYSHHPFGGAGGPNSRYPTVLTYRFPDSSMSIHSPPPLIDVSSANGSHPKSLHQDSVSSQCNGLKVTSTSKRSKPASVANGLPMASVKISDSSLQLKRGNDTSFSGGRHAMPKDYYKFASTNSIHAEYNQSLDENSSDPDYNPTENASSSSNIHSDNSYAVKSKMNSVNFSVEDNTQSTPKKRVFKSETFVAKRKRTLMDNTKRELVKGVRAVTSHRMNVMSIAKKTAVNCQKHIRREAFKSQKIGKDYNAKAKRIFRESCIFWKKFERVEKEHRKRIQKQVMEQRQMEQELKEMKRQQRKLNYLITQTELFAHFMSRKTNLQSNSNELTEESTIGNNFSSGNVNSQESANNETEKILSSLSDSFLPKSQNSQQLASSDSLAASFAAGQGVEVAGKKFVLTSDEQRQIGEDETANNNLEDEEDYEVVKKKILDNTLDAVRRQKQNISQFTTNEGETEGESKSTNLAASQDIGAITCPDIFCGKLKQYQLHGVTWLAGLYEKGINGILADEMGLGKTVQTIAMLAYLAESQSVWGPFLVVAPASTLHNWQQEISRFVPSFKILPYWGNGSDRKSLRTFWNYNRNFIHSRDEAPFHVLVSSYQLIVRDYKYFNRIRWQYMVLDEAQAIKSSSSQRWKSLLNFSCRNRLLLTGTPIQNNMAELWALLHFIMPTLFDSHQEFNEWFSKDIEGKLETNSMVDQNQLSRLHMILKPFMLRRIKKEVENELTDKIEIDLSCELSRRQRLLYQAIKNKISVEDLLMISTTGSSNHPVTNSNDLNVKRNSLLVDDSSNSVNITTAGISGGNTTSHLMNIVMQFRKVCNHPELFERKNVKSPLVISHLSDPSSCMRVPKILHQYNMLYPDNLPISRRFLRKLSIFTPENIHSESLKHFNDFGFLLFLSHISLNSLCDIFQGDLLTFFQLYFDELSLQHQNSQFEAAAVSSKESPRITHFYWHRVLQKNRCDYNHYVPNSWRFLNNYCQRRCSDIPRGFFDYKIKPLLGENARNDEVVGKSAFQEKIEINGEKEKSSNFVTVEGSLIDYPRCVTCFNTRKVVASTVQFYCYDINAMNLQELYYHPRNENIRFLMNGTHRNIPHSKDRKPSLFSEHSHLRGFDLLYYLSGGNSQIEQVDRRYMVEDSGKISLLDSLLPRLQAQGHRVLIYSQMTRMIDLLEEYLTYRKYRYLRLDGSSKICDRRQMVADFQSNSNIFAFLLSTRAGGLGINLTAADTVIFYDCDWNPTVDQQAMDRAHRLGQTRQVTVYRLICKGTIEEKIQSRARKKSEIQRMVIAGNRFAAGRANSRTDPSTEKTTDVIGSNEDVDGSSTMKQREVLDLLLDEAEVEEKFRARHAERQAQYASGDGPRRRGRKRRLKLSNVISEVEGGKEALEVDGEIASAPPAVASKPKVVRVRKPRLSNAPDGSTYNKKSNVAASRAAIIAGSMAAYSSLGLKLVPESSGSHPTNLNSSIAEQGEKIVVSSTSDREMNHSNSSLHQKPPSQIS